MQKTIEQAIVRQAKKIIEREKRKIYTARKFERKFELRSGIKPTLRKYRTPGVWSAGKHFDPYYCITHSKFLAKSIWTKLVSGSYKVSPAVRFQIPKDKGGFREIMVFSIPDAAIANIFNRKMRDRNKNLQSPFCYSYRRDRSIFDAVLKTSSMLSDDKNFVVQIDFSRFFDSISHVYFKHILDSDTFFISPMEKRVINAFLQHEFADLNNYKSGSFEQRIVGTPQGSSISLFLSNIAAHDLDRRLEGIDGNFVRFADDTLCVARTYASASEIVLAFKEHCRFSGISINFEKSPGISLLANKQYSIDEDRFFYHDGLVGNVECPDHFDFIGHKFSHNHIEISTRGIRRVKARVSRIIYLNLLYRIKRGEYSAKRVGAGFVDWDLVTCINELRKYIYGGLKRETLTKFIDDNKRISRFKGLMSFYPLVTRIDQFRELDGWLKSILRRALRERQRIIKTLSHPPPINISEKDLLSGAWFKFSKAGSHIDTSLPSFVLAWRAARKAFKQYGLDDFSEPGYYSEISSGYGA